jgi:hypothetical protein
MNTGDTVTDSEHTASLGEVSGEVGALDTLFENRGNLGG